MLLTGHVRSKTKNSDQLDRIRIFFAKNAIWGYFIAKNQLFGPRTTIFWAFFLYNNQVKKNSGRLLILDFLRGVAICCVVFDHLFVWLSAEQIAPLLHHLTIYSVVPLFFLAGITYTLSFLAHPPRFTPPIPSPSAQLKPNNPPLNYPQFIFQTSKNYLAFFYQKSRKLLFAYLVATLLITLIEPSFSQGISYFSTFDLAGFLSRFFHSLLTFPGPFYFIALYLELLLVAPLIIKFITFIAHQLQKSINQIAQHNQTKSSFPTLLFLTLTLLPFFLLALLFQDILILPDSFWLPLRQLLGGLEFFVFAAGAVAAYLFHRSRLSPRPPQKNHSFYALLAGSAGLALILAFSLTSKIFSQPPNLYTLFYAACATLFLFGLYHYRQKFLPKKSLLTFLGAHSLDIFIFHSFSISFFLYNFPQIFSLPLWGQFLLTFALVITASLLISWPLNFLYQKITLTKNPRKS